MRPSRWLALGLLASPLAGCGDDTIQLKPGQGVNDESSPGTPKTTKGRPGPTVGRPEDPEVRAADDKVEAQERANTPTSTSLRKR